MRASFSTNILNAAVEAATGLSRSLDAGWVLKEVGKSIGLAQQSIPRRMLHGPAAVRCDCLTHASILPAGHAAKSGRGLTSKSDARVEFLCFAEKFQSRTSSAPRFGMGESRSCLYTHTSCCSRVAEMRQSCRVKRRMELLSPVLRTIELIFPALIGALISTSRTKPLATLEESAALDEMSTISRRRAASPPSGSSPPTS